MSIRTDRDVEQLKELLENASVPDLPENGIDCMRLRVLAALTPKEREVLYHRFKAKPGLKPGECCLCREIFATDGALYRHLKSQHGVDPDSPDPFRKDSPSKTG